MKSAVAAMKLKGDEKFDPALPESASPASIHRRSEAKPEIADYISGRSNDLKAGAAAVGYVGRMGLRRGPLYTGQSHYAGPGYRRASISSA